MLSGRLFVQVCLTVIGGLFVFALIVSVFWHRVVDARFNSRNDDSCHFAFVG